MSNHKPIRLLLYVYNGDRTGYRDTYVFVDLDNMSPDPSGMLMWGYVLGTGETLPGDWKSRFRRATYLGPKGGVHQTRPVVIEFKPEGKFLTAAQEKSQRAEFIRTYTKEHERKYC
jgi:hypothetical protein